jgi:hypothetical protein
LEAYSRSRPLFSRVWPKRVKLNKEITREIKTARSRGRLRDSRKSSEIAGTG